MAEASAFDRVCAELEERTTLDRLEARGTVRLALKKAGLEARRATPQQMAVLVSKVLPAELLARGVAEAEEACRALAAGLERLGPGSGSADTPDAVFARLGGGAGAER